MNFEIANAMSGYIETLYVINQKIIKMCGIDVIINFEYCNKEILDIMQDIPRLIPYRYDKNSGRLRLDYTSGLLEFNNDIPYLENYHNKILKDNYFFLDKIRKARNKYMHKMHGIRQRSSGSGTLHLFDFTFEIEQEDVQVTAGEFLQLIKQLNLLFSKIVHDIRVFAYANKEDSYEFYRKLMRFDFKDFNDLYECNMLRKIGKIMYGF